MVLYINIINVICFIEASCCRLSVFCSFSFFLQSIATDQKHWAHRSIFFAVYFVYFATLFQLNSCKSKVFYFIYGTCMKLCYVYQSAAFNTLYVLYICGDCDLYADVFFIVLFFLDFDVRKKKETYILMMNNLFLIFVSGIYPCQHVFIFIHFYQNR